MKNLRIYIIFLLLVLTVIFFAGCTSLNATTTGTQTDTPVSVTKTPIPTIMVSATQTTILVDDASVRKAATTNVVPVGTIQNPVTEMLQSESWIRPCPVPPGGQEYFSYIEDGGQIYVKYDSCGGAYYEWYSGENNLNARYASRNESIDNAFNIMTKASKSLIVNASYSKGEQNKKILDSAMQNAVSVLPKGEAKGEFVNTTVARITDPGMIEEFSVNSSRNNEVPVMQVGCREYLQQFTSGSGSSCRSTHVWTTICPGQPVIQSWQSWDCQGNPMD